MREKAVLCEAITLPFLDLDQVHREPKDEILADIMELIDAGAFTNGPEVGEFELSLNPTTGSIEKPLREMVEATDD